MKPSSAFRKVTTVVGCASIGALCLLGADAVSYAATGDSLIIGQVNTAGGVTTLRNTGSGATLSLVSSDPTKPNLKLSSVAKVAKLNADFVDGQDSSAFLAAGGKAADADLFDGLNSSSFLKTGDTAVNADNLDGMDSSQFVQGQGQIFKGARALAPDSSFFWPVITTTNPALTIGYNCPTSLASNGVVVFRNDSGETINVFSDNGGSNPAYQPLGPGGRWDQFAAPGGERYSFQVQGSKIVNIELYSVHRATDCHIQGQAIVMR